MKNPMKILRTLTAVAAICLVVSGTMLTSCDESNEIEDMNESSVYYNYRAYSKDFEYKDAPAAFEIAIRNSVGLDPILGGNDSKVIEACDACYDNLKQQLSGMKGKVLINKIRHPDGRQKKIKEYKF